MDLWKLNCTVHFFVFFLSIGMDRVTKKMEKQSQFSEQAEARRKEWPINYPKAKRILLLSHVCVCVYVAKDKNLCPLHFHRVKPHTHRHKINR